MLKKTTTRAASLVLLAASLSSVFFSPASLAAERRLQMPKHYNYMKPKKAAPVEYTPDLLLVMPNAKAEGEDVDDALKEVKGTVVGSIGEGELKCLIVQTEKGKLEDTEKKLTKDNKNFSAISRNYGCSAQWAPSDQAFALQWWTAAVNAPKAWDIDRGAGARIAVFDTGCQANIMDLRGKTSKGYDCLSAGAMATVLGGPGVLGSITGGIGGALSGGATTDSHGHGTAVATTAAATANSGSGSNTCGIAPDAHIYPVRIANINGRSNDISIMAGLLNMVAAGCKIINISFGNPPPFGLTNHGLRHPLHVYMAAAHRKGALIILSMGNDGMWDPNPRCDHFITVSAVDRNLTLTDFSNCGTATTFTAPGKDIICDSTTGAMRVVDGTSFSAPIVAGIAALMLSANPGLSPNQIKEIMKRNCITVNGTPGWNALYGYGMPDAERCVKAAKGIR